MPSLGRLGFCGLGPRSSLDKAERRQKAICAQLSRVKNSPGESDLQKLTEATEKVAKEFSRVWGSRLPERDSYCFRSQRSGCVAVMAVGEVRKELGFPLGELGSVGNAESFDLSSSKEGAELAEFSRRQEAIYKRYFSGSGSVFYSVAPDRDAVFALGDNKVMDRLKADFVDSSAVDTDLKNKIEQTRQEFWAREQALQ